MACRIVSVYPREWAKREPSPAAGGESHEGDLMRIEGVIWHRDVVDKLYS